MAPVRLSPLHQHLLQINVIYDIAPPRRERCCRQFHGLPSKGLSNRVQDAELNHGRERVTVLKVPERGLAVHRTQA